MAQKDDIKSWHVYSSASTNVALSSAHNVKLVKVLKAGHCWLVLMQTK